jgi:hypothetical protein
VDNVIIRKLDPKKTQEKKQWREKKETKQPEN